MQDTDNGRNRPSRAAAVAGIYLGRADHLPLVALIGRTELWLAVAAFLATLAAMPWHLWVTLVHPGR
jgi:hypothetical protein